MTDPRWDRVLPIFEDEQVLLTRLMSDRLVPGQLVLDVGTGSGVFAIWAAKKGRCRVMAIDISARSIRFGKQNARRNGVTVVTSYSRLRNGAVMFLGQSVDDFAAAARANTTLFDLAILNPPFNPTCEVVRPALHADAGPDAQRPFERQIRLIPQLLKVGGFCLGVQMSYDRNEHDVGALRTIRRAFRDRCRINYSHAHARPRTVSAADLVKYEYEAWLNGTKGSKSDRAKLASYLERVAGHGQRFSLIHYEVRRESSILRKPPIPVPLAVANRMAWEPRFWCHRCIADFAAPWPEDASRRIAPH